MVSIRPVLFIALAITIFSSGIISLAHAQTVPPKFTVGTRVQTTDTLTVRSGGWGWRLGSQPKGAQGVIVDGPKLVRGYYWYQVNYDAAPDGWSVQDYLTAVPVATAPAPVPVATATSVSAGTPSLSLVASVYTIPQGGSTDLIWKGTNVTACVASRGWDGSLASSGTKTVSNIAAPTYFAVTCKGLNTDGSANTKTVTKSVYVRTTSTTVSAPSLSFSVTPASIAAGGQATLNWTATNAGTCTASGGWSGTRATSGSETISSIRSSQTYTLTCTGSSASAAPVTKSVTVSVTSSPTPTPTTPAPSVTFSANASTVTSGGSATLTWSSTNATSCTASGNWSGTQATSGTKTMTNLTSNQTYTLSCTGAGGTTAKTVSVTVTAPVVSTPSTSTGSYSVYQGCEAPATSYARTIYVDPAAGSDTGDGTSAKPFKTLTSVLSANKLLPGDHVILLPGDHGSVFADQDSAKALVNAPSWIWVDFKPGAVAHTIDLRGMNRWLITGAEVTPLGKEVKTLVTLSNGSNMVFADGTIYNTKDSSGWGATQWINTNDGYFSRSITCSAIERTTVKNVRMGVVMYTDSASPDASQNSVKGLVQDVVIRNFSADGIRPIGSDLLVRNNYIFDEYVGDADGDGNHDDGIQSWALNGAVYQNITIDHNWVQESTDPSRKWNATMQGITSFDGVMKNIRVTNNVILGSAYHGLTWNSPINGVIDHNTVFNPTNNGNQYWIYAPGGTSTTISNNVANLITWMNQNVPGVTMTNNYETSDSSIFRTFSPSTNTFDLRPRTGGPIDGKNIGATFTQPTVATAGTGFAGTVAGVSTAAVFERLLTQGMTGDEIMLLQRMLAKRGFLSTDQVTGYFGPATKQAVKNFQQSNGLEQTGSTGPLTRAALNRLAGE